MAEARAALAVLAGHHLLEETSPGRFGCHDLLRSFAVTRFVDHGSEQEKREGVRRLAEYYLRAVTHASQVRHRRRSEADGDEAPPPPSDTVARAEARSPVADLARGAATTAMNLDDGTAPGMAATPARPEDPEPPPGA